MHTLLTEDAAEDAHELINGQDGKDLLHPSLLITEVQVQTHIVLGVAIKHWPEVGVYLLSSYNVVAKSKTSSCSSG